MAGRRCPGRDEVDGRTITCPVILTQGQRYCPRHARAYEARRGTTTARGMGADHQRMRARIQSAIDAGVVVRCWSCGTRLVGTDWHLDHSEDRRSYRGPACVSCNTSDGGARGAQASNRGR